MNSTILKANWSQLKGALQEKWSELTDDDIAEIAGKYDKLVAKLEEYYGYSEEEARKLINKSLSKLDEATQETVSSIKQFGNSIQEQAHKSPWTLAAITTVAGLAAGLLLKNKLKFPHVRW